MATTSTKTINNGQTACLEVTDVRHGSFTYDATQNVETKDCVTP